MIKTFKTLEFFEAVERSKYGEKVYAIDFNANKPIVKLFSKLTVDDAINNENDLVFAIVEEVSK